jgi:hypothetical protein
MQVLGLSLLEPLIGGAIQLSGFVAGHLIRAVSSRNVSLYYGLLKASFRFKETSRRGLSSSTSCVLLNHPQSRKGNPV